MMWDTTKVIISISPLKPIAQGVSLLKSYIVKRKRMKDNQLQKYVIIPFLLIAILVLLFLACDKDYETPNVSVKSVNCAEPKSFCWDNPDEHGRIIDGKCSLLTNVIIEGNASGPTSTKLEFGILARPMDLDKKLSCDKWPDCKRGPDDPVKTNWYYEVDITDDRGWTRDFSVTAMSVSGSITYSSNISCSD